MTELASFPFDNSFAREMEGFYVRWQGARVPRPEVLRLNRDLAAALGFEPSALAGAEGAAVLSGAQAPEGALPLAMVYAGHQFGGFSPQLGDGRALLVGEIVDPRGRRSDLHLKGSGRTPFSRGGDGKAVLGPVLREYLFGEAMHAMGIATTRALAVVTTGEEVDRNGYEPGAVLARVAASHLRVGTFQYFAARGETDRVRQLADYAITRHYPELAGRAERYLELFRQVRDAQAALVAQWMLVGFVHGVMNTDNTTISGETIDYGPCAFIDRYDPKAVFSSIDRFGRYGYGNQPAILQWNLARFAETLIDLVAPADSAAGIAQLTEELKVFGDTYQIAWLGGLRTKLGLGAAMPEDEDLAEALLSIAAEQEVDFTRLFRALGDLVRGKAAPARGLFRDPAAFDAWAEGYRARIAREEERDGGDAAARAQAMDRVNPLYIPRNHKVEEALAAAVAGDMGLFDRLLDLVSHPYAPQEGVESYALGAPEGAAPHVTFCGT
ncbi:MAG: YdiU family protein [Defluviimonas sp.]|uniref:protein adenylyltransferase SelO n=1 Tax=Albidovulum sp. TaxID=1872424 RepID=UPI001D59B893|nr:YdiU family protein [Paracoccaceae bacterium]MCC0065154.1 YdiU family protein [Defluviimonas sp.]